MATNQSTRSPLLDALDDESYQWLTDHQPRLLDALQWELDHGKTPEQLRRLVQQNVGPERAALGLRIEQAARSILAQRQAT